MRKKSVRKQSSPTARCVACGEKIMPKARVCSKCGSYQTQWKSRLQFIAAVAGVATLLASAFVWLIGTVPKIRTIFAWRTEVRVVAFDSTSGVTFMNVGDGPVLLSHFMVDVPGIDSRSYTINELIAPGQVLKKDFGYNPHAKAYILINHGTLDSWRRAIAEAKFGYGENCVAAVVMSENDPTLMMYKDVDAQDPHPFRFLRASMSIHYNDLKKGVGGANVPVRGVLYARRDCPAGRAVFPEHILR